MKTLALRVLIIGLTLGALSLSFRGAMAHSLRVHGIGSPALYKAFLIDEIEISNAVSGGLLLVFFVTAGAFIFIRRRSSKGIQAEHRFACRSVISAPASAVWDFHASPQALHQLTPPPIFVKINQDKRISLTEGDLDFTLWFGPLPVRWIARHELGDSPDSFRDRMLHGPMKTWIHEHSILPQGESTILEDRLVYSYTQGWRGVASWLLFNRIGLHMLFAYRHLRTRIGVREMRI